MTRTIYCVECDGEVVVRLTDGGEIYPHRKDLAKLPFWVCDVCGNSVGCHHKTKNRTAPLGVIANAQLKNMRIQIHKVIDALWEEGIHTRSDIYTMMSQKLGCTYHTGKIKSLEEAEQCLQYVQEISSEVMKHKEQEEG